MKCPKCRNLMKVLKKATLDNMRVKWGCYTCQTHVDEPKIPEEEISDTFMMFIALQAQREC
jgi:hypothetical protein